jgi:peptidoglycan/xylan/chitin deacetylase (PgdA/CDA1 family)
MRLSFLVNNVQNLVRNLRQEPLSAIPGRLAAIARPKLIRLSEELAYRTPAGTMLGRAYRGKGIVVMFHEIHADVDAELRTGCDAAQLERVVGALRASGRDIVTVEEGLRRLADPDGAPFALLTFDDAYRDNLTMALPVLERLNAPMTLFVPTGMITRGIYAWWLGIRTMIGNSDALDIQPMGRRLATADLPSKLSALRQITSWIGTDQARADSLAPLFAARGIDIPSLVDHYAMNKTELRRMADHPLVEIGAHTETHRFLSGLPEDQALAEFQRNKAYLESLLDRSVSYLAYPYGTPAACAEREARLAVAAGFRASFTTRHGHLFAQHLQHPQLLPRIDVGYAPQSAAALASRLSGLDRAMSTRFGDPVAVLS